MAEVDGSRTHLGRDAPHIGFEDRAPHQRTNYLRDYFFGILRVLLIDFNRNFLCVF